MNNNFISEYFETNCLLFSPRLAVATSLNAAIVLCQVHYWLKKSRHFYHGRHWVFNSYRQWQSDNFPFWHVSTVRRILNELSDDGLLHTDNFNKRPGDKTLWYTIDYEAVEQLCAGSIKASSEPCPSQSKPCSERTNPMLNMDKALPMVSEVINDVVSGEGVGNDRKSRAEPEVQSVIPSPEHPVLTPSNRELDPFKEDVFLDDASQYARHGLLDNTLVYLGWEISTPYPSPSVLKALGLNEYYDLVRLRSIADCCQRGSSRSTAKKRDVRNLLST